MTRSAKLGGPSKDKSLFEISSWTWGGGGKEDEDEERNNPERFLEVPQARLAGEVVGVCRPSKLALRDEEQSLR